MQCQKQNDKNKILKKKNLFVRFSGGGGITIFPIVVILLIFYYHIMEGANPFMITADINYYKIIKTDMIRKYIHFNV